MFFCCAGEIAQADKTQLSAKAWIKSNAQPERKNERNVRGNIGLLRSEEKQRRPSQKQDANGIFSAPGRSVAYGSSGCFRDEPGSPTSPRVFVPQVVEFHLDRDGVAASEPYTKGRSDGGKEKYVAKFPSATSLDLSIRTSHVQAPADSPSSLNASSGLAARRNFIMQGKALNVITGPMEEEEEKALSSKSPKSPRNQKKSIRWVDNFGEFYDLGKQVMPSCHKGMQILHATRRSDNLEVVVKVRLKNDAAGRKNRKGSWLGGAEFMLNLPPRLHIARIFDVVEDRDAYYVVMEKVSGKDLFEAISGKVLLPTDEVKDIIFQILAALADLHAQGQIHKDLKLENVMIDRPPPIPESSRKVSYGQSRGSSKAPHSPMSATSATPVSVKLIDFDTLEQYEAKTPKAARDVLGTNQYIAQEAYDGQYSPASDIFAAGVIGYRLLTGKYPFKSDIFDDKPGENWVGSPKMLEIRSKVCDFQIKWTYPAFESQPEAGNLLQRMLAQAARDRPSAKEALQHPWLARASSALASPKSSAGGSAKGGSSKGADARRFSDVTPGGPRCAYEPSFREADVHLGVRRPKTGGATCTSATFSFSSMSLAP